MNTHNSPVTPAQKEEYIDTPEALESFCEYLTSVDTLALDTEFAREKTYYSKLCLIQIATEDRVACIDPLRLDNIDPLLAIIFDPTKLKLLHAARQDLEIFYNLRGSLPAPIFDTQIAATVLGYGDQTGYGNLVSDILKIQLDKAHTRTDWTLRPLQADQIRYAADDVRYLLQLYPEIKNKLNKLGRLDWIEDDFSALCESTLYENPPEQAWQRVSGRQKLKGIQLALLQHLAAWRERRAQQQDRPRRWVLNDDVLITLSRQAPTNIEKMAIIRGLPAGLLQKIGNELLQIIATTKTLPKEEWPTLTQGTRPTAEQDLLADAMMTLLRLRAMQNNISPTALATRKDIERIAMGQRDVPLLHGWRSGIAGEAIMQLMRGEVKLEVKDGALQATKIASADNM